MALKQTLAPAQKQTLKMSFGMRQSLKVLALNGMDLCAYAAKQLEDNPAAEPEFLEFGYVASGESDLAAASGPGLQEAMLSQLRQQPGGCDLSTAECILANCDDDGYLRVSEQRLSRHLDLSVSRVHACRLRIRSLEPAGIASLNLKECLKAQLQGPDRREMEQLIEDHLEDVALGRLNKITADMHLNMEQTQEMIQRLRRLDPRPGLRFGSGHAVYVRPDIRIVHEDGELAAVPVRYLKITVRQYDLSRVSRRDRDYMMQKTQEARRLDQCISKRQKTLQRVVQKIVDVQRDYLLGAGSRKVLRLKDLSAQLQLSPATISRTLKDKNYEYQEEIWPLKDLLCRSVHEQPQDEIREAVRQLILSEDKTLSDGRISALLKEQGIVCARRTIAKYRSQMSIDSLYTRSLKKRGEANRK